MSDSLPADVIDDYFPDLFNDSLVDGKSFQVPWYQAVPVELVNTEIFTAAGLTVEDFPETFDGIPALCQTIKDKTGKLCDIRLTVNDYLAQMVYEGGVDVINADGTAFTFDNAEGVAWVQTYVDMVKAGTVDKAQLVTADDRTALELFTSGNAPVLQHGPAADPRSQDQQPGPLQQARDRAVPGREVGRHPADLDGDLGQGGHGVPEGRPGPRRLLHQPDQRSRVQQDRRGLPVDARSL